MDIKDFKERIDNGEVIELHNESDVAHIYAADWKSHRDYVFMFNGTTLFSDRSFSTFRNKVTKKVFLYSLSYNTDDDK